MQLGVLSLSNSLSCRCIYLCINSLVNISGLQETFARSDPQIKPVHILAMLTRNTSSNCFPELLSVGEYNLRKKSARYQPFKDGQFVRVCIEKMIEQQYWDNGTRDIYAVIIR